MKVLLVVAALLMAAAAGVLSGAERVSADHEDAPGIMDCFQAGQQYAILLDTNESSGCRGEHLVVTRNVVEGSQIPVCTIADYDESTRAAVDQWNSTYPGTFVLLGAWVEEPPGTFTWEGTHPDDCPELVIGSHLVSSVIVDNGALSDIDRWVGTVNPEVPCTLRAYACVAYENIWSQGMPGYEIDPWYASVGRTEVRMNAEKINAQNPPWLDGPTGELKKLIAHELGHALAIDDRDAAECGPTAQPESLMFQGTDCESPHITPADEETYAAIYTPGAVDMVESRRLTASTQVEFKWIARDVHVEHEFEIQRREGRTWTRAGTAFANIEYLLLGTEENVTTTYRIVSTTQALAGEPPRESISAEVTVAAAPPPPPPPPPTRPRVSISTPDTLVQEGDTEGSTITFTVSRNVRQSAELMVTLHITQDGDFIDGTFVRGVRTDTATIPANATSVNHPIMTAPDVVDEDHGSVTATIAPSNAYTVGSQASASVQVRDDDKPRVSIDRKDVDISEVAEGTEAEFVVRRATAVTTGLPVEVAVTGSASFIGAERTVTVRIRAGETSEELAIPTAPDEVDEPDGEVTVTVTIGADALYDIGSPSTAMISITDDDPPPAGRCRLTVSIEPGPAVLPDATTSKSADSVPCGQAITVSASSGSRCYDLTHWTGVDAGEGTENPATVTMDRHKTVTAHFAHDAQNYTLEIRKSGSGTVTLHDRVTNAVLTARTFPSCTVVKATAAAAANYEFDGWLPAHLGTANSTYVAMWWDGWIEARFGALSTTGTFTVTGTGSSQAAAARDAAKQAAAKAAERGADRHSRTGDISYGTSTRSSYLSLATVRWALTGSATGTVGPLSTQSAAETAAIAKARAAVPSGATVTGTSVESVLINVGVTISDGWWAEGTATWRKTGGATAFGAGSTAAAAEADAYANASAGIPAGATATGAGYFTQEASTVTTHTATATYSWERDGRAAGSRDRDSTPPAQPGPPIPYEE